MSRSREAGIALAGPADLDELEARFLDWGNERSDVRAVLILGSRARVDHPADEWADVDFAIAVKDPERYMDNRGWLKAIGPVAACYRDPNPGGATLHTLFASGVHADFGFLPVATARQAVTFLPWVRRLAPLLNRLPGSIASGLEQQVQEGGAYLRRGTRTIIDKDGLAERFLALFPPAPGNSARLSEHDFTEAVNEFWFNTVWIAKHLRRGELWWATREGWGAHLLPILLRMIEWRSKATHGFDYETWQQGRFLEEWAEPRVVARIRHSYPAYDPDGAWESLLEIMNLFRELAHDTADGLGLTYPTEADALATGQVTKMHAERD